MEMPINTADFLREVCSLLESHGVKVWVFGGWGEELHKIIKPRLHKDIDLLYPAKDFTKIDKFIAQYALKVVKDFPHKRAFLYEGVMIEIFLVVQDGSNFETNFFSHYMYRWPDNTFIQPMINGINVASTDCLFAYRKNHSLIEEALGKYKNL